MKRVQTQTASPKALGSARKVFGVLFLLASVGCATAYVLLPGAPLGGPSHAGFERAKLLWQAKQSVALALSGKEKELESFRITLSESSLTPGEKRALAFGVAWRLAEALWERIEEARSYAALDPHHPHLEGVQGESRRLYRLFGTWSDQALSFAAQGQEDQGPERHWLAYAKGVLAGWMAEFEPDLETKRTLWTDSVTSHLEALAAKPGDPWTQENLEILEKRFSRRYGFGKETPRMRASRGALGERELRAPVEGKTRGESRPHGGLM
jgi:hypothetical protein